jgi:hypothetical protein
MIGDMIHSMEGFHFASSLDLNMGHYHIKLDADAQLSLKKLAADAQKLCII